MVLSLGYLTCHLYREYTLSCIEGSEDTRHMYVHEHQDMKADYQNQKKIIGTI